MDSWLTDFLANFPTRLLSAPSGMSVELSSASFRSVVAASALSFKGTPIVQLMFVCELFFFFATEQIITCALH